MGWVGIPFNLRVRNDYAITIALRLEISTDGISLQIHLCAGYIECVGRKGGDSCHYLNYFRVLKTPHMFNIPPHA